MNNLPLVSVIIVNYSGKKLLEKCLASLSSTTYTNYEIILVDNHSNDDSVEFVRKNFPSVQILELNKNYGFATPNNIASKTAKGKHLVFLNNDTQVTSNWLSELVSCMEGDKTIAIAQSLLIKPDGKVDSSGDFVDSFGRTFSRTSIPQKIESILSARGACMMVRKDIFLDLGGFDETYFVSFEDVDLGWRAWRWGYKVVIVPSSIVYHMGGETIQKISKTIAFHGVKNFLFLGLTNFDFFDMTKSVFFTSIIVLSKKFFGKSFIKNSESAIDVPDFKTIFRAIIWIFQNFRTIIKKRKILKSRQVRTNKEIKEMGLIFKNTHN